MTKVFSIKATILNSEPPIFRELQIDSDINLQVMHEVMQALFNWGNIHLHYFRDENNNILKNEEQTTLLNSLRPNAPLTYVYDYGDSWTISMELIREHEAPTAIRPICTNGQRQSPPEDCGGMVGYEDALDLLAHHNKNKYRKFPLIAEWYGEDYNPEHFDIAAVNARLGNVVLR